MTEITIITLSILAAIAAIAVWSYLRVACTVWSYQEGLLFRHGKFVRVLAPGRHVIWGAGQQVRLVETQLRQLIVQSQEISTRDKASVKVSAIAHYRVVDGLKFISEAQVPEQVLYAAVQMAVREIIGAESADRLLESKSHYGSQLKLLVNEVAEQLGLRVESIDIRDIILSGDLKKAYAGVLYAKKEALAGLEKARGEAAALRTLANGARLFESNPQLLKLRYLQLLEDTRATGNSTLVLGPAMEDVLKQQIVSR